MPTKVCFIYNIHVDSRPIHSLCPQTTFLIRLSHSRPLSTCPITPEPCIRQLGTVPIPQSPLPLFNPANPILLTLPHPFLSAETIVEAFVYVLPSLPLLPDGPRAPFSIMVPTMAWCALFSWDLCVTNYIFSGNHLLTVASTHLNNNKTYKAQHL